MAKSTDKIPSYVLNGLTVRQWKSLKRKQLRAIQKAFEKYRSGCAYCPGWSLNDMGSLDSKLNEMIRSHSIRNWGR